jgi:hypothetical protein
MPNAVRMIASSIVCPDDAPAMCQRLSLTLATLARGFL